MTPREVRPVNTPRSGTPAPAPAPAPAPGHTVCNKVLGDVGPGGKVVQANRAEFNSIINFGTRPVWVPPGAPADPPRYNHESLLSEIRTQVRTNRAHSTLAVVSSEQRRHGGSTVCRAFLSGYVGHEREYFPGGFYVADLRHQDRRAAVSSMLRRLGLTEAEIPIEEQVREDRLREELGSRGSVAVLVDNAYRFEDVRPFLSAAAGSVTLVATDEVQGRLHEREPWVWDLLSHVVEFPVRVPAMDVEERIGVLALHSGLGKPEDLTEMGHAMAEAIVKAIGDDLGAVRQAGYQVKRECAQGRDGLRLVYEATAEGKDLMADDGLDGLTTEQRVRVVELACHPATDFGVAVAVTLWGGSVGEAGDLLDGLVARGCLSRVEDIGGEPRFRFVDRGRAERIRATLRPSGVEDARERIFGHYRDLARRIHAVCSPHRWLFGVCDRRTPNLTEEQAHALVEVERNTLRTVILDAIEHKRFLLAFEMCEALWAHWFPKGCFSEVVDTHTTLIKAVSLEGRTVGLDPARASRLLVQRSIAYRRDREFTLAEEDAESALRLARSAEPVHELALLTALEARGDSYREHSATGTETEVDLRAAEEHFAESCRVAEGLVPEDVRALANAMRKLGEVRFRLGSRTEARSLLERVEQIWRTRLPDDPHNLARTLTARGDLEAGAEDGDTAVRLWSEALELHRRIGDGRRAADLHVRRADVFELGDREACLKELREALRLYEETDAQAQVTAVREMITVLEGQNREELG